MAKAEWGLKRVCPHCATRYYDMKKNPPVCPSCGAVFDPEALTKSRRRSAASETARKAAPSPETLEDLPVVTDDVDDDAIIEDADELEDDMDVEDVVEVEDDEEDSE